LRVAVWPLAAHDVPPTKASESADTYVAFAVTETVTLTSRPLIVKSDTHAAATASVAEIASAATKREAPRAKERAELAELAKKDFAAAVKKGDSGSTDDAGKMYQGILEPGPEVALFTLEPEHVAGPVDTPRGFWIVRRIK
jgi:hypothetical protein